MYAAYVKGGFAEVEYLPRELEWKEFRNILGALLAEVAEVYVLFAENPGGKNAVGVAAVRVDEHGNRWPHVSWYPWATTRNRLEASLKFLADMSKEKGHKLLISAEQKYHAFFIRLCQYGVLRVIGKSKHYFRDGGTATLLESTADVIR